MTNAEKYLKDGVSETDIDLLAVEIIKHIDIEYMKKEHCYSRICPSYITTFFEKKAKPTLTEDERVILRNIREKENKYITRDTAGYLYITETPYSMLALPFCIYNHLFQFIKERRRIFY